MGGFFFLIGIMIGKEEGKREIYMVSGKVRFLSSDYPFPVAGKALWATPTYVTSVKLIPR